jgi:hypothetical protein
MVRPERVHLAQSADGDGAVPVQIVKRVFSGDMLAFTLRTEQGLELIATKPSLPDYRDIQPEARVWMTLRECRVLGRDPT